MPSEPVVITTIDAHAAGEPLRVITSGYPPLPGKTVLEKRRYAREHLDHLRTALMWEPRGHADMYGALIIEPERPDSHLGVLFLHNEGYSTMCGHGIIGLTTVVLETGMLPIDTAELRIDAPAGLVKASAKRDHGRVLEVSFLNVPSFVYALDKEVDVPGVGRVRYDVAFGGAFYAFCRAEDLDVGLKPEDFRRLIDVGMRLKKAVMESLPIRHPFAADLGFLYGTIIVGPPENPNHHSRNVCVFADGEVDRSPTGTGVSARAALHFARGEIGRDEPFIVESLVGTCFTGRVKESVSFGPYPAVIPQVSGSAWITGRNEWIIHPDDPLRQGFILR